MKASSEHPVPDPPLPYLWERLTADDFAKAVRASDGVALLPLGCLEKHGRHLPLGTDILIASELCRRAASVEPAVVVPCPPFGLVSEVRNGPGTLALRADTLLAMLRDLCADLARNGLKKIVIVNGHGGNQELLRSLHAEKLVRAIRAVRADAATPALLAEYRARSRDPLGG